MFFCCCRQTPCQCQLFADDFEGREQLGNSYAGTGAASWSIEDGGLVTSTPHAKLGVVNLSPNCAPREIHFTVALDGVARFRFAAAGGVGTELEFNSDAGRLSLFEWDGLFGQLESHRLAGVSYPLEVRVCIWEQGPGSSFKVYTRGGAEEDWTYRFGYPRAANALPGQWWLASGSELKIDNVVISQNTAECPQCCKCFLFDCPDQIQVTVSGMLVGSSGPRDCAECEKKRGVFILDRYPEFEDEHNCVYALEGDFGCGCTWMVCRIGLGNPPANPFLPVTTAVMIIYGGAPSGQFPVMSFHYPFTALPLTWDGFLSGAEGGYHGYGGGYCYAVNLSVERVAA